MPETNRNPRVLRFLPTVLIIAVFALPCRSAFAEPKLKYFGLPEGRLAFTYTLGGNSDIYVVDFENIELVAFLNSDANEQYPRWSPDGERLALHADIDGNSEIYLASYNGAKLSRVTNDAGRDFEPDWSPDGKRLVFRRRKRGTEKLLVVDDAGTKEKEILSGRWKFPTPRWSPRGGEILYSSNKFWPGWDVFLYQVSSGESKVLSKGNRSFRKAAWHPDGGSYVFSYGSQEKVDIWVQEKGDQQPKPLIQRPGKDFDPEWTHDGKRVFFAGEVTPGEQNFQIFVYETDSQKISQVTSGPGSARFPSWTGIRSVAIIEDEIKNRKGVEIVPTATKDDKENEKQEEPPKTPQ